MATIQLFFAAQLRRDVCAEGRPDAIPACRARRRIVLSTQGQPWLALRQATGISTHFLKSSRFCKLLVQERRPCSLFRSTAGQLAAGSASLDPPLRTTTTLTKHILRQDVSVR